MTPNVDRSNRRAGDFGYWKTSQKVTTVYMCDDASGLEVGKKRCFAYFDASNKNSQWLMHEYTTIDPNIPVGSREDNMKVYTYQDNQSIESNEDNFSINVEELLEQLLDDDYADSLKPGYRLRDDSLLLKTKD
nr:putative NAC domain-containing protein [Tanacetum cinerariifolium]